MIKRDLDSPLHPNPRLAWHACRNDLLKSPVKVIDAGALGGLHRRWLHFAPYHIRPFLFDPQMDPDSAFTFALGDQNGTTQLQILADRYGSSIRNDVVDPALDYTPEMRTVVETRQVQMRTLDSLWGTTIPAEIDVLKIDCEGYERKIVVGAQMLLQKSEIFLAEVEMTFNNRAEQLLYAHAFRLVSLTHNALPYRSFMDRARALGIEPYCEPAPTVFQAVFYRDRGDDPIKRAAVLETYGICDLAYDICMRHGVDQELADLLIQPSNG